MVGFAVKITVAPWQTAPDGEAVILTLAGSNGFTVIVITLDVAGLPVAQVAFEVIVTVICSPLMSVDEV